MAEQSYRIRLAVKEDCPQILTFVKALADEIKPSLSVNMTAARLEDDGFPSQGPPAFTCHVAERQDTPGVLVGICFHYLTYSARVGRTVYLEDLYVVPECRGGGLGTGLIAAMTDWALNRGCCRINCTLADGDVPVKRFYQRLGAMNLTAAGWHLYRISDAALHRLAAKSREEGGVDSTSRAAAPPSDT